MVPLICIDVIRLEGTTAYVAGSDFFASATAYREDSRRVTTDGARQTPQGSNGKRFDRTTLMASHNVFQNRRVVANLAEAGRISGDTDFSAACALTDLEYARRLDFLYGKHKI
jgi:carbohydrate-selective porin OprB